MGIGPKKRTRLHGKVSFDQWNFEEFNAVEKFLESCRTLAREVSAEAMECLLDESLEQPYLVLEPKHSGDPLALHIKLPLEKEEGDPQPFLRYTLREIVRGDPVFDPAGALDMWDDPEVCKKIRDALRKLADEIDEDLKRDEQDE